VPEAEDERRIIIAPGPNRLSDLVDILPTIEEMDAAVEVGRKR
jgi:anthranilate/para-aminobenzoate synthase component II